MIKEKSAEIKKVLFNNLDTKQTIFKNTFWLGIGMAFNKLLALGLVIYAARILGAVEYGKFSFAIAFVSLLMIFSDLGLSTIITREFAHEGRKKEEIYSILSLKVLLAFGTLALILLISFFTIHDNYIQKIILILAFYFLINSLMGLFYSFFHARQRMEYEAWPEVLQVVLIFILGIYILLKLPSAENLSYAYLFSSFFALVFILVFVQSKIFPLKMEWDFSVWKKFLIMSWPLALMGVFGLIYSYTDSVMLGYWKMLAETGWYNAAQKIITGVLVPMGLIGASFYPALSKSSKESREKFQKVWNYELEIMILIAMPLVIGGMALAQRIIYSLYSSAFSPSVLVLQMLILTAGITFIYRPFYDAMIVLNQQTRTFLITLAGAIINVVLNFILIPKYTLYGSAAATIITNFLVLFIIVVYAGKFTFVRPDALKVFFAVLTSLIASAAMLLLIKNPFFYNSNLLVSVLAGTLVYFVIFWILKKYVFGHLRYASI